MNTPYPEPQIDPEALAALFAAHNRGVERARAEYARHPFARCSHGPHCARQTRRLGGAV
jgi:hypothetical protein